MLVQTRVYIAGPITGYEATYFQRQHFIINAAQASAELIRKGYNPFCPHTHNANFDFELPEVTHEGWLKLDFEWLRLCHALLRLDGFSTGADREVSEAHRIEIPVFYRISDLTQAVPPTTEETPE